MKSLIPVLVLATAVSSFGATGRIPGLRKPAPSCPALVQSDLQTGYAGPTSGCSSSNAKQCQSGESIVFTASIPALIASCGNYAISWNFGDGTTAVGSSVTHTFSSAATFAVNVTVSNAKQTLSSALNVAVVAPGPVNRVLNGTFDHDLSSWTFDPSLPGGQGQGDASWTNLDASGSASSGSILLRNTATGRSFQQVQCVSLTPNERYTFGADVRTGGDAAGGALIAVAEFATANCTGTIGTVFSKQIFVTAPLTWTHGEQTAVAGSSTHSGYVFLAAGMTGSGSVFQAWFDNVFLKSAQ